MAELKNCPVCGTPARMMVHDGCYSVKPIVPRWIPVEERLPEEGKNVLIFVKCMNNWWHIEVDWRIGGCWFNNAETDWNKITHWMHLPEPPEEGKE